MNMEKGHKIKRQDIYCAKEEELINENASRYVLHPNHVCVEYKALCA